MKHTKLAQAVFVQISGVVALFADKIDGLAYVALSTLALGVYSTAEVIQKNNEAKNGVG